MQLLNPQFSKIVRVYHDPKAKKSMSIGIGAMTLDGGNIKSYYIAKGTEPAVRFKKKHYNKEFLNLWSDSKPVIEKYTEKKWNNLTKQVLTYSGIN